MIDFACRKFYLEEVIRCSFNLSKTEYKILEHMMKNSSKEFTAKDISKLFNLGLSTAQRAVKKINKQGLVKQRQKNLKKGGYIFVYCIKEKHLLKKKILDIIDSWVENVEKGIKRW